MVWTIGHPFTVWTFVFHHDTNIYKGNFLYISIILNYLQYSFYYLAEYHYLLHEALFWGLYMCQALILNLSPS